MAILEVIAGAGQGTSYELDPEAPFQIGASRRSTLRIREHGVSFNQAEIRHEEGVFVLHAKRSSAGTYVNGEEVKSHESKALAEGSIIKCGSLELRFRAVDASAPPAEPAGPPVPAVPHAITPPPTIPGAPAEAAAARLETDGLSDAEAIAYLRGEALRLAEELERTKIERQEALEGLVETEAACDAALAQARDFEGRLSLCEESKRQLEVELTSLEARLAGREPTS